MISKLNEKKERERKEKRGAGEMAQRLRALAVLSEVLSSIPSNYMVAHLLWCPLLVCIEQYI